MRRDARRTRVQVRRSVLGLGIAATTLLSGCGSNKSGVTAGTSGTGSTTTVPTATTTAPTLAPTAAPTTAAPTTVPPTTAAETTTTTVAPAPASVLLASASGIVRITGSSSTTVTTEPAAVAVQVDATVYFQASSGRYGSETGDPTAIRFVDPTGVKELLVPGAGEWLTLHSAGHGPDGHPLLVYSVDRGVGPPIEDNPDLPQTETLYVYDIATASSTEIAEIGAWESGTGRLQLGAGVIVGTWGAEASHGLLMLGLDGSDQADPARFGLEQSYDDCSDCPTAFTVDSTGALLAWVDEGVATIADLASGTALVTLAVPTDYYPDAQVSTGYLVLNRVDLPPVLVEIATGAISQLPAGTATLLAP